MTKEALKILWALEGRGSEVANPSLDHPLALLPHDPALGTLPSPTPPDSSVGVLKFLRVSAEPCRDAGGPTGSQGGGLGYQFCSC
jgi:hypothetical protein